MAIEKGLIERAFGDGLVGRVSYHAGERKMKLFTFLLKYRDDICKKSAENVQSRGRMVDRDMKTLNNALKEILDIAEKKGYNDIIYILKDKEYECGI